MKRVVFFTLLFTVSLVVGKRIHFNQCKISANYLSNSKTFIYNQDKISDLNQIYVACKSTDFDLEEEFSSNNDSNSDEVLQIKPSYLSKWYLSYDYFLHSIYCSNSFYKFKLHVSLATPLYITQNVLRI